MAERGEGVAVPNQRHGQNQHVTSAFHLYLLVLYMFKLIVYDTLE